MVYQDYLRLTPDAKSKNGYIWNKNVCPLSSPVHPLPPLFPIH